MCYLGYHYCSWFTPKRKRQKCFGLQTFSVVLILLTLKLLPLGILEIELIIPYIFFYYGIINFISKIPNGNILSVNRINTTENVYFLLPEERRPLGRPRRRWKDNIKMDLQEDGGGRGDWMELTQDRDRWRALVGTVRDFRVP